MEGDVGKKNMQSSDTFWNTLSVSKEYLPKVRIWKLGI